MRISYKKQLLRSWGCKFLQGFDWGGVGSVLSRANWVLLVLLTLNACEKKTDWKLKGEPEEKLVVEGLITNELKPHYVRLSTIVNELNAEPTTVSGAKVRIDDRASVYELTEDPPGSGWYWTDSTLQAVIDVEYILTIELNGLFFTASTYMEPVIPLDPLVIGYNDEKELFRIDWINEPWLPIPSMYQVDLDWSQVSGYESLPEDSVKGRVYSYTFSTIDVSQIFLPETEKLFFPEGTIITEKKYSLTSEHEAFLRAMISETHWKGGFFDEASADIPTNMSLGAVGFFAASTVVEERIVVGP